MVGALFRLLAKTGESLPGALGGLPGRFLGPIPSAGAFLATGVEDLDPKRKFDQRNLQLSSHLYVMEIELKFYKKYGLNLGSN